MVDQLLGLGQRPSPNRRIIYICFLISGAAGLIYEVVWARQLSLFLGITTYANTAVITAYMAGLAAGSLVIGRLADRRKDCLRLYAWLEVGVGLYAAATPWLFTLIQTLYAGAVNSLGITGTPAHLLRFVLALLGLLAPTFLMGGTLPLLVRGLIISSSLPDLATVTGRLYGINTLGAALGAFSAGYLLLPALGVRGTIFLAVLLNLIVAAAVLALRRQSALTPAPTETRTVRRSSRRRVPEPDALSPTVAQALLIGLTISGFAALVYEIAWIRALTLVIGSSVYAFSTVLTTYLVGLALGSLLYARFLASARHRPSTSPNLRSSISNLQLGQAAMLEAAISLIAVLGLPLIGQLPGLFMRGFQAGLQENFVLFQAFIFGLCFLLMFLPTLLLGALFPLITALWTRGAAAVGRGVGTAYGVNTAGAILGALLGGLLLLPTLGVHNSLLLAAGLHLAVGASFWLLRPTQLASALRYGAAAVALLLFGLIAWLVPPWDQALMTSGVFSNAEWLMEQRPGQSLRDWVHERKLLYYAEGIDGIVSVVDTGTQLQLIINGKTDASSKGDLPTEVMSGQLPMLMHPDPREVLVIGLGSGITVGSVATHASASRIDVLEISPEVAAASQFFAAEHGDVLSDARVNLIVADGRNFVLAQPQTYDVIISEPSNPWISGISNLFTQNFFELARARLAPGGIMAQWFHTYSMSTVDVKTVLRTYQAVFPHVTVWMPLPGDLILIGAEELHALNYARLQAAMAQPSVRADLARVEMGSPEQLARMFLLGGVELADYTAGAALNTDDRPRIEFNAPRNLYAETTLANLVDVIEYLGNLQLSAPISGMATATADGLDVPAMGLAVSTTEVLADDDWRAGWLVERQILSAEQSGEAQVAVSSQRLLIWREGEIDTRVQAVHLPTQPAPEDQQAYLEGMLTDRPVQGGQATLPDGLQGLWTLGHSEEPGKIELGISWTCPSAAGGVIRYVAFRRLPDSGGNGWETALSDLAGRFRCK